MEPLKRPGTVEGHAYMAMRQRQNRVTAARNLAEEWVAQHLATSAATWTAQAQWGYRLYDFWSGALGCAVEVDGPSHDKERDAYSDEWHFRRSAIVVLRVPNFDEAAMASALEHIRHLGGWKARREQIGVLATPLALVELPHPPALFPDYLARHAALAGARWAPPLPL